MALASDEVHHLPGWSPKPMFSKMYSGYLDATPPGEDVKMHMHYIFIECEDPDPRKPVLVWSNGGPGAASEFGLFTELGPYTLSEASLQTKEYNATGIPSLYRNPFSWTRVANVLIYDSPPPVGFSYCNNNITGDGYSCGNWDDFRTAKAAHQFMKSWANAYPTFAKRDLYLSGESYAGVYIPMLAREILQEGGALSKTFKGMAIGDGCVGSEVLCGAHTPSSNGPFFYIEFFHGHGQVSDKLYNEIYRVCGVEQLKTNVTDPHCQALIKEMDTAIGGAYAYNLYDECGKENVIAGTWEQKRHQRYWSAMPPVRGALNDYPCGGAGAMTKWLETQEVKAALHIPAAASFFLSDNGVGFNYSLTETNLMPFYQHLAHHTDARVLVYNGDTDPGINSFIAQNWTVALGFKEKEPWRPWTLDGQQRMGGYVTRYEGDFDFLTIRGSGHMVPEYKPPAALRFITQWLAGQEYDRYVPPPPPAGAAQEL